MSTTHKNTKKIASLLVLGLMASALGACQTTGTSGTAPLTKEQRIDSAVERAAEHASRQGSTSATLLSYEKKYKRNPEDPQVALNYAKALRQSEVYERAALVLEPFAKEEKPATGVLTELSMIFLSSGNHDKAEKYAKDAILQDPEDYLAYQYLGIALDAKEMHPEAERAFRKGLEHWQGNPTTIMNNLALNLATQGFIDEAVEVLEKAKAISPDRIELERNLRIIRTLNER